MNGKETANLRKLGIMEELGPDVPEMRDLFVNLTHAPITLILNNGRTVVRLEPVSDCIKLKTIWSEPRWHGHGFKTSDGIRVLERSLPEPEFGVILIVPAEVAYLERHRDDVFAPGYDGGLDETGSLIVKILFRYK